MKSYSLVISSVKRISKCQSQDFVRGYIISLWDWNVIDNDDYKALKDFIISGKEID